MTSYWNRAYFKWENTTLVDAVGAFSSRPHNTTNILTRLYRSISISSKFLKSIVLCLYISLSTGAVYAAQEAVIYFDFTGDEISDVIVKDTDDQRYSIYNCTGTHCHLKNKKFGRHSGMTAYMPGFFTSTSQPGVVMRRSNGYLYRYDWNTTHNRFDFRNVIGTGWNFTHYLSGNFDSNGLSDIIVRDSSANLRLYTWNGSSLSNKGIIGTGWNFTHYFVMDYDQDGVDDIIVRNSQGKLLLYYWDGLVEGFDYGGVIGTGFDFADYMLGDFDGDGIQDLICKNSAGELFRYQIENGDIDNIALPFDIYIEGFSDGSFPELFEGTSLLESYEDIDEYNEILNDPYIETPPLDPEKTALKDTNNDDSLLQGRTTYFMMSLLEAYKITKDIRYLDSLVYWGDIVLSHRDTERTDKTSQELQDKIRGEIVPAWSTIKYYGLGPDDAIRYTHVLQTGLIAYPLALFSRIILENEALHASYLSKAIEYRDAVFVAVEVHDEQWADYSDGTGYYKSQTREDELGVGNPPFLPEVAEYANKELPMNYQLGMGRALIELARISDGSNQFLDVIDKVKRLAKYYADRLTNTSNPEHVLSIPDQNYTHQYRVATEVSDGCVIKTEKTELTIPIKQAYRWYYAFGALEQLEDFDHAAIDLDFAAMASRNGLFHGVDLSLLVNAVDNVITNAPLRDGPWDYLFPNYGDKNGECAIDPDGQPYPFMYYEEPKHRGELKSCGRMLDLTESDTGREYFNTCTDYLVTAKDDIEEPAIKNDGDGWHRRVFWYLSFIKSKKWD